MIVSVIGSRTVNQRHAARAVYAFKKFFPEATMIVSGGARGGDQLAEHIARELEIPIKLYLPNWKRRGKVAGFLRNTDIARECDICLAFLSHPLAESRGSADTIRKVRDLGKRVVIIYAGEDGSFYRTAE